MEKAINLLNSPKKYQDVVHKNYKHILSLCLMASMSAKGYASPGDAQTAALMSIYVGAPMGLLGLLELIDDDGKAREEKKRKEIKKTREKDIAIKMRNALRESSGIAKIIDLYQQESKTKIFESPHYRAKIPQEQRYRMVNTTLYTLLKEQNKNNPDNLQKINAFFLVPKPASSFTGWMQSDTQRLDHQERLEQKYAPEELTALLESLGYRKSIASFSTITENSKKEKT